MGDLRDRLHIKLITDGSFTDQDGAVHFSRDGSDKLLRTFIGAWATGIALGATRRGFPYGADRYGMLPYLGFDPDAEAYVLEKDYLTSKLSGTLMKRILSSDRVHVINPTASIHACEDPGEDRLSRLFKVSGDPFEEARRMGKRPMAIVSNGMLDAANTGLLVSFVQALMACYGDGWLYYFKAHPRGAASFSWVRTALESNGLDARIRDLTGPEPLDILLARCPEAKLSGFTSTSFIPLPSERKAALFMTAALLDETEKAKGHPDWGRPCYRGMDLWMFADGNAGVPDISIEVFDEDMRNRLGGSKLVWKSAVGELSLLADVES